MKRLTREKDSFECRIKECFAEDWMFKLYGDYPSSINVCECCPFMPIVNKLAEFEDEIEKEIQG